MYKYTVNRTLSPFNVERLCFEHGWYLQGSKEEFDEVLQMTKGKEYVSDELLFTMAKNIMAQSVSAVRNNISTEQFLPFCMKMLLSKTTTWYFVEDEVPKVDDVPKMEAKTPLGTLTAYKSTDPAHPGIYIDLYRDDKAVPLALVEYSEDDVEEDDVDSDIKENAVVTRVWGDGGQEDYTERIIHENIEKAFEAFEE